MKNNEFDRAILYDIWEDYPPYFLHNIGLKETGRPDAFHHIISRRFEDTSSIFNACPVHNQTHLKYHGKLLLDENQRILLNQVAKHILIRLKLLSNNDLTFKMIKYITPTDKRFISRNIAKYEEPIKSKLLTLINSY